MVQRKGIDVSVHNGLIDWDQVKADGIEFAMIRLGVGSDDPNQDDAYFERNVSECERVGILWGVYIYSYALTPEDARSERDHALRLLQGKHPSYPVGFDMEDADGYKKRHGMPSDETLVDICYTFLNDVEQAGYYVILYASKSWLENQLRSSKLDRFDKWVAQWNDACNYDGNYSMWQYTNMGRVNGINVDGVEGIDMNYSYRDYASNSQGSSTPSTPAEQPKSDNIQFGAIATVTILVDGLSVRTGPGLQYDVVDTLPKGGVFLCYGVQDGWANVGSGWVRLVGEQEYSRFNPGKAIVKADILNVRTGPGTDNSVCEKVKNGQELVVWGTFGVWVNIGDKDGHQRWVHGAYVTIQAK